MGRARFVLVALVLAAVTGVAFAGWRYKARESTPVPVGLVPGEGERIVVEVLNGTHVDGLARAVTRRLRLQGIDVVYYGSARESVYTATQILVRRGDSVPARKLREALGVGRVLHRPAEELLLDLTVILGLDAAPRTPPESEADRTPR